MAVSGAVLVLVVAAVVAVLGLAARLSVGIREVLLVEELLVPHWVVAVVVLGYREVVFHSFHNR